MMLEAGSSIGPYVIKSALGAGGMGEVYRARDSRLKRDVAIKVLHRHISDAPRFRARFEREARAVASINHSNVITVHDFGESSGRVYITFEFVDGETLQELLSRGRIPLPRALDIAVQITDGLAAAHDAGVIHRDLKPRNLMITPGGRVKILDFGLVKFDRSPVRSSEVSTTNLLSEAGRVLGTVGYMAPEQVLGGEVDARADQFVVGVVLYEMLSGLRAFRHDSVLETMAAIVEADPLPLSEVAPHVPLPVSRVVARCLSKEPADRYSATADLVRDLRTAAEHIQSTATPVQSTATPASRGVRPWWFAAALGVASIILVVTGMQRGLIRADWLRWLSLPPAIETLSVLPIETSSTDPAERAYWSGVTQAITTRLAALPAGRRVHVTPPGEVLGATHILRGRADPASDVVRVELVEAASGQPIRQADVNLGNDPRAAQQNRLLEAIVRLIETSVAP